MISPKRNLCDWSNPASIAQVLIQHFGEAGLIWLDGDGTEKGRWAILGVDPVEQICSRGVPNNKISSNPFTLLRNLKPGHWTGWLSYEAAAWLEPKNPWKEDAMATLWLARHDPVFKFDLLKKELWIEGCDTKRFNQQLNIIENIDALKAKEHCTPENSQKNITIPLNKWKWLTNKKQFITKVHHIKNLIQQGDIFQANLSACCTASKPKDLRALDVFKKLKSHCPAPFSGIIVGKDYAKGEAIISTSPERFLKVMPNGQIETRPIKGTRPRQPNVDEDSKMAVDLICSPKDRAENIMIVDLLRNDLGKVCQPGSIKVSKLCGLESYSKVHHLTSVINGSLKKNKTWIDLLEACWPGGSITGAPKLRACQRLHELEPIARGPYCGSFLHIDWNGTFDSNILIRSFMLFGSTIRVNAGCGIVADSNADTEAEELAWKLIPLLKALEQ